MYVNNSGLGGQLSFFIIKLYHSIGYDEVVPRNLMVEIFFQNNLEENLKFSKLEFFCFNPHKTGNIL